MSSSSAPKTVIVDNETLKIHHGARNHVQIIRSIQALPCYGDPSVKKIVLSPSASFDMNMMPSGYAVVVDGSKCQALKLLGTTKNLESGKTAFSLIHKGISSKTESEIRTIFNAAIKTLIKPSTDNCFNPESNTITDFGMFGCPEFDIWDVLQRKNTNVHSGSYPPLWVDNEVKNGLFRGLNSARPDANCNSEMPHISLYIQKEREESRNASGIMIKKKNQKLVIVVDTGSEYHSRLVHEFIKNGNARVDSVFEMMKKVRSCAHKNRKSIAIKLASAMVDVWARETHKYTSESEPYPRSIPLDAAINTLKHSNPAKLIEFANNPYNCLIKPHPSVTKDPNELIFYQECCPWTACTGPLLWEQPMLYLPPVLELPDRPKIIFSPGWLHDPELEASEESREALKQAQNNNSRLVEVLDVSDVQITGSICMVYNDPHDDDGSSETTTNKRNKVISHQEETTIGDDIEIDPRDNVQFALDGRPTYTIRLDNNSLLRDAGLVANRVCIFNTKTPAEEVSVDNQPIHDTSTHADLVNRGMFLMAGRRVNVDFEPTDVLNVNPAYVKTRSSVSVALKKQNHNLVQRYMQRIATYEGSATWHAYNPSWIRRVYDLISGNGIPQVVLSVADDSSDRLGDDDSEDSESLSSRLNLETSYRLGANLSMTAKGRKVTINRDLVFGSSFIHQKVVHQLITELTRDDISHRMNELTLSTGKHSEQRQKMSNANLSGTVRHYKSLYPHFDPERWDTSVVASSGDFTLTRFRTTISIDALVFFLRMATDMSSSVDILEILSSYFGNGDKSLMLNTLIGVLGDDRLFSLSVPRLHNDFHV